jgi:hypothetical protein
LLKFRYKKASFGVTKHVLPGPQRLGEIARFQASSLHSRPADPVIGVYWFESDALSLKSVDRNRIENERRERSLAGSRRDKT